MIDDLENEDPGICSSAECALHTEVLWESRVVFRASAWFGRATVPVAVQEAFVEFLAEFSEGARASFGNVADDNAGGRTALEVDLPRSEDHGVLQSDDVLRGYSWVTVCPPALVGRLGGYEALEATGAFAEVRRLDYGAALLRATDRLEQYDDDAIRRVFHALAPVLPRGKPRQSPIYDNRVPPRLVYEDPADYS
ncbi:hypothetical protein ACIBL3_40925 [Kribbella sp. NPDC050124]|uniref:hypothetical protein n=1 Tax=Kribbella sp. NPDC050124 TaxID=3364114 RepID=UPI0037BA5608